MACRRAAATPIDGARLTARVATLVSTTGRVRVQGFHRAHRAAEATGTHAPPGPRFSCRHHGARHHGDDIDTPVHRPTLPIWRVAGAVALGARPGSFATASWAALALRSSAWSTPIRAIVCGRARGYRLAPPAYRSCTHQALQAERERSADRCRNVASLYSAGVRTNMRPARRRCVAPASARDGDRIAALRGSVREPPTPARAHARLRVLDELVRGTQPAARTSRPRGSRRPALAPAAARLALVVLADPASFGPCPNGLPSLAQHHEVIVLCCRPLELPPDRAPAVHSGGHRVELDLARRARNAGATIAAPSPRRASLPCAACACGLSTAPPTNRAAASGRARPMVGVMGR